MKQLLTNKYFWIVAVILSFSVLAYSIKTYTYKKEKIITQLESQVKSLVSEKQILSSELSTQKTENKTLSLANEKLKKEKAVTAKKYYPNGQLKSEFSSISSTEKNSEKKDLNVNLQDTTKMSSIFDSSKQQEYNELLKYKQDTLKIEKSSSIPTWVWGILGGLAIGYGVHK